MKKMRRIRDDELLLILLQSGPRMMNMCVFVWLWQRMRKGEEEEKEEREENTGEVREPGIDWEIEKNKRKTKEKEYKVYV